MGTNVRTVVRPLHNFRPFGMTNRYSRMLDAIADPSGSVGFGYLVTIFTYDQPGFFRHALRWLREPALPALEAHTGSAAEPTFSVQSAVAASLSGIGVVALVACPIDASSGQPLGNEISGLASDGLAGQIEDGLDQHLRRAMRFSENDDLSIRVKSVARGDDHRIYRGREFREVRFGLPFDHPGIAEMCGKIIHEFAGAVTDLGMPLAYLYYPHDESTPGEDGCRWLQIGYAIDANARMRAMLDMEAWQVAKKHDVALRAYQPSASGPQLSFVDLHRPASQESRVTATTDQSEGERAGVCMQGLARLGLVEQMRHATEGMHVHGILASALCGHAVCNLIIDPVHQRQITDRMTDEYVMLQTVSGRRPPPPGQRATFWVAWRCRDDRRVVEHIIEPVYDRLRAEGLTTPNIDYMMMRTLQRGETSAGKIMFSYPDEHGRSPASLLKGLKLVIEERLGHLIDGWEPTDVEWRDGPVIVSVGEPTTAPWAGLVGPEGVVMGSDLAVELDESMSAGFAAAVEG